MDPLSPLGTVNDDGFDDSDSSPQSALALSLPRQRARSTATPTLEKGKKKTDDRLGPQTRIIEKGQNENRPSEKLVYEMTDEETREQVERGTGGGRIFQI